jgi:hypothetical protein
MWMVTREPELVIAASTYVASCRLASFVELTKKLKLTPGGWSKALSEKLAQARRHPLARRATATLDRGMRGSAAQIKIEARSRPG